MDKFRTDLDALGRVSVPCEATFGPQTQRSIALFPTAGAQPLSAYPFLIEAMLYVKRAVAKTNVAIEAISEDLASAIDTAISHVLTQPLESYFPIHSFHGGGGIGINMNVNEVIANLGNQLGFDAKFGTNSPLNPNDHINLNHSTSDALSTSCHIAVRAAWTALNVELLSLSDELDQKAEDMGDQPKLARTCLQDAVDIRAADYFAGVAYNLRQLTERAGADANRLADVNLGGNIIGRSDDCDRAFFDQVIDHLNEVLKQAGLAHDLRRADNLFAASQAHNPLQNLSSSLEQIARTLIRFGGDLRLMASGPDAGFSEITLPKKQPGSSAIPGKINPTIPEFTMQCAMMACGNAASIRMTQDHGELDYNPWQMLVVISLLDMIAVLQSGVVSLRRNCVQGLELNIPRNSENAEGLGPSLIQLKRKFGYSRASAVAKQAAGDVSIVRAALSETEGKK